MHANVGDTLTVFDRSGGGERSGTIKEVKGDSGNPPYVVEFEDGHSGLVHPGPDSVITPAAP
ncbi:hypothetical protein SXANM310S_00459 [Streptomyces xanthochromogenes]